MIHISAGEMRSRITDIYISSVLSGTKFVHTARMELFSVLRYYVYTLHCWIYWGPRPSRGQSHRSDWRFLEKMSFLCLSIKL